MNQNREVNSGSRRDLSYRKFRPSRALTAATAAIATVGTIIGINLAGTHGSPHAAGSAGDKRAAPLTIGSITLPKSAGADVTVSYPANTPSGYSYPSGIAADPAGDSIWYFAESRTADTLFHYDAIAHMTTRYSIRSMASLRSGLSTPIVATGRRGIWIGVNSTLVEVNPATGAVRTIVLPPLPLVPRHVAITPTPPPGDARTAFEEVESMTAGPGGLIYLGRLFAADVQTYDPRTRIFGTIPLPADSVLQGAPTDLAAGHGSTLYAALWHQPGNGQGFEAVARWSRRSWSVAQSACGPAALSAGAGQVLMLGAGCASLSLPGAGVLAARGVPLRAAWHMNQTGIPLSSSAALIGTADGAEIVSSDNHASAVNLGQVVIGAPVGGSVPPGGIIPVRRVAMDLGLVAAANSVHIWFTSGRGGPQIGLITLRPGPGS